MSIDLPDYKRIMLGQVYLTTLRRKRAAMKKTVLIAGCSSGIGNASARIFASKGWNVAATMRNVAAGKDLTKISKVLVIRLDVQDRESIDQTIRAGISRFGRIDVLINSAGYGQYGLFAIPREKIHNQFDVNVFGVMDVTRPSCHICARTKAA